MMLGSGENVMYNFCKSRGSQGRLGCGPKGLDLAAGYQRP